LCVEKLEIMPAGNRIENSVQIKALYLKNIGKAFCEKLTIEAS